MKTMTPTPMAFNNPNHTPEIQALLRAVEETFGRSVASTSHFTALSYTIESVTGNYMSDSTLKRLWNYVPSAAAPRISTLDILSQYAGYRIYLSIYCLGGYSERRMHRIRLVSGQTGDAQASWRMPFPR